MTISDKLTEDRIFDAANEVFTEKGMDGARMQEIADRAGINKSLLHYYYRSKEKLFNAVFEKTAARILSKFAPVLDEQLSLEEKIRFFFRQHISFLQENPRLPSFFLNEINRNPERIKKFIRNLDINLLHEKIYTQHESEFEKYKINRDNFSQIMTSIAAISVFPFVARGIIECLLEKTGTDFNTFTEQRKDFAADFVIKAIKK